MDVLLTVDVSFRLADKFAAEHPEWDDEQLYQVLDCELKVQVQVLTLSKEARKWNIALLQRITMEEVSEHFYDLNQLKELVHTSSVGRVTSSI
jgi:hypothetical protein